MASLRFSANRPSRAMRARVYRPAWTLPASAPARHGPTTIAESETRDNVHQADPSAIAIAAISTAAAANSFRIISCSEIQSPNSPDRPSAFKQSGDLGDRSAAVRQQDGGRGALPSAVLELQRILCAEAMVENRARIQRPAAIGARLCGFPSHQDRAGDVIE